MAATSTEQLKENKMGTQPIMRLIITMSLPAMFSMLVQALYNIVDSYFVSIISENALTAVSLAFPIQTLLIALAVGTGVGINSLVARRLGERKKEDADSAATHGIILGVINWTIFAIIGLFFSRVFFQAFTDIDEIISMGTDYMSVVCIFSFGVFIEINIEKTLQATGNMFYPMVFQLVGAITNIILDPIFIFGVETIGLPAMGVTGAAIATVIGQIISMVVAIFVILFKEHEVQIDFRHFRIKWETIKNIYIVGLPSIIMQAIGSVMTIGMNAILISFNETAVAVFGVYFKLQSFVFMPVFGLTQGIMPIIGYNYGAHKKKRLLLALKLGCFIALGIMAIGTLIFWLFPDSLLSIFQASPTMLQIGRQALRLISLCFIPAALGILFSTLFQAIGSGVSSLVISLLRQLIVLLPAAFLLSKISLDAVWFAFPLAEIFSLAASILIFLHLNKKMIQPIQEPAV